MLVPTTRRTGVLRLLITAIFSGLCSGCAATGNSLKEADKSVVTEMTEEAPTANIELMVSNGKQAEDWRYPTTLSIWSDAARGFPGGPGSAGECSGVLIADDLVLTAAHCMCSQPLHAFVNKSLNRSDCATRAQANQYKRQRRILKNGVIQYINEFHPMMGSAFLPVEFRVDLNKDGEITSIGPDVAIIRLDTPIHIRLDYDPADRGFKLSDRIIVVGFGSTSVDGMQASESPHFGSNVVTDIRLGEHGPVKPDTLGGFTHGDEANTERGDSGGPCFREEGQRRWLMGIMLHKTNFAGIKTSCLDLFYSKDLVNRLIQQARDQNQPD